MPGDMILISRLGEVKLWMDTVFAPLVSLISGLKNQMEPLKRKIRNPETQNHCGIRNLFC